MTRIGKQQERRAVSRRRPKIAGKKTGPKKDNLEKGYREQNNAIEGDLAKVAFFPKLTRK